MGYLEVFPLRLKQIREEMDKTQKEFSDLINVKQQSLSGYENGKVSPPLEVLVNISEKCSVSIDWLCGQSDDKRPNGKVVTYADLFLLLVKADEGSCLQIGKLHPRYIEDKEIIHIFWPDPVIEAFLEDWDKIKRLYHEGTINKELYDLWIKNKLKQKNYLEVIDDLPI